MIFLLSGLPKYLIACELPDHQGWLAIIVAARINSPLSMEGFIGKNITIYPNPPIYIPQTASPVLSTVLIPLVTLSCICRTSFLVLNVIDTDMSLISAIMFPELGSSIPRASNLLSSTRMCAASGTFPPVSGATSPLKRVSSALLRA